MMKLEKMWKLSLLVLAFSMVVACNDGSNINGPSEMPPANDAPADNGSVSEDPETSVPAPAE